MGKKFTMVTSEVGGRCRIQTLAAEVTVRFLNHSIILPQKVFLQKYTHDINLTIM